MAGTPAQPEVQNATFAVLKLSVNFIITYGKMEYNSGIIVYFVKISRKFG